jgi:hypothetical protein
MVILSEAEGYAVALQAASVRKKAQPNPRYP